MNPILTAIISLVALATLAAGALLTMTGNAEPTYAHMHDAEGAEVVFVANLTPDCPPVPQDPTFRELLEYLRGLTPECLQQVIDSGELPPGADRWIGRI